MYLQSFVIVCDPYYFPWFVTDTVYSLYYLGFVFILNSIAFSEILYHVRSADEATGGVRAGVPDRAPLPYLAPRHFATLRELHHAAHHTQHHSAHVQGRQLPPEYPDPGILVGSEFWSCIFEDSDLDLVWQSGCVT